MAHDNIARPDQGIAQQIPIPQRTTTLDGSVHARKVLGGFIHDHYCQTA
jgi:hypothetical protein